MDLEIYNQIRSGRAGFYRQKRGLIAVHGKEAVQFLDGMITNDVKTLEDGQQMLAAFPNAQGRLVAVVRVLRQGDRFLFETEGSTRERLYQNLFRCTFCNNLSAVFACGWAQVNHPIRFADSFIVMFNDQYCITEIA